ncbi:hypothetical protein BST50_06430 [Vibrio vulnificus]|uniref:restriction endonuclease subunit S n=1 Tax=Vibrio vulnificus TaxID=672 RepID=UPI000BA89CE3|nr:restriction endonuclease subunit S [Vibrio vulnificus]PAO35265.1 hypothetical protein BST49_02500 [Vibrio vulnificus]PAO42234.1 hypothetical protein BST50_06430 [Vibrio vulnificus]PAO46999.1 hypothetical protein BST53_08860 [Vibrio vulnificus]PAO50728.1 hypothetical protein BST54_07305 [Vibrio vulnificus]PAO59915.1 hypothetical protein BST57_05970 [Vibrio vulnificus]
MSSDWKEYRLGDVTSWSSGGTPSKQKEEFWNGGIPWISASSMGGNRYSDSENRITEVGLKAGSRLAPKDTVLLLVRGSILHQKIPVGIAEKDVSFNQDVKAIRVNEEFLEPWFLLLWFMANEQKLLAMVESTGIGAGKLDTKQLQDMPIRIPPKQIREKIISTGKGLDDKLVLNTHTNQTLEQIAQAIFKSWFVDFDPVKAKMETLAAGGNADDAELAAMGVISAKTLDELNSLKASNPEAFNKLAQTAALFPAAMQDSELGEVPEGWEVKQLKDILELAYGKALKKTDRVDGDVPVYGSGGLTGYHNQSLVEGPGIIVGRKGTVGSVYWEPKAFYPIDTVFYVKPRAGYSLKYCHLVLQNLGLKDMNTDAAVPGLNRDNAYRLDVITPTKGVMNLFKEIMQSLQSNVDANNAQSASLESLRDTLLPKLLSGEIDLTSEVTA